MRTLNAPTLDEIRAARERLAGVTLRTPLVRLNVDDAPGEVWLKLENLQPIGSFKLRGAANAMRLAGPEGLRDGVYTASAGNMAQGVAWSARELGVPAAVVVPDHAPATKLAAIERLGGRIVKVPFDRWWQVIQEHTFPGMDGLFIHPVADRAVMAGNGTIGPGDPRRPAGRRHRARPLRRRRPLLRHRLRARRPAPRGARLRLRGGHRRAPHRLARRRFAADRELHPQLRRRHRRQEPPPRDLAAGEHLLAGARVVPLEAVAAAVRLLAERHRVIAEGAGATSVAAALAGVPEARKIVCVISGGNLDFGKLCAILDGRVPS